jgi:hypothetical protein
MSRRTAKKFEMGNPYLVRGGICYFWPGDYRKYEKIYGERRTELSKHLLEEARSLMSAGGFDTKYYPYLQSGEKYETISTGDGGEWMEFGYFISGGMASFHNVDDCRKRIVGFNLTSDALEFLDQEMLAPRINVLGDGRRLVYPLARMVPDFVWTSEWIKRVYKEAPKRILRDEGVIEFDGGRVCISEGNCVGELSNWRAVTRATFLLAKIADASWM